MFVGLCCGDALGQHIGLVNKSTGKTSLQLQRQRVCLLGTAVDGVRAGWGQSGG